MSKSSVGSTIPGRSRASCRCLGLGGPPPLTLHPRAVALSGSVGPNFEVTGTQYGIAFATFIAPSDGSWSAVPFLPSFSVVDTIIGGTVNDGRVGRVTAVCYPCTFLSPPPATGTSTCVGDSSRRLSRARHHRAASELSRVELAHHGGTVPVSPTRSWSRLWGLCPGARHPIRPPNSRLVPANRHVSWSRLARAPTRSTGWPASMGSSSASLKSLWHTSVQRRSLRWRQQRYSAMTPTLAIMGAFIRLLTAR